MKWLTLKIYNSTALFKEYEQVQSLYHHLQSNMKLSKTKKAMNDLNVFKEEIKQRIRELNEFYSKHINDSRIGTFEIIKNKLESLLANKTGQGIVNQTQKITQSKSQSALKKNSNIDNNNNCTNNKISNAELEENDEDEENDIEIFTCCNQLLASE